MQQERGHSCPPTRGTTRSSSEEADTECRRSFGKGGDVRMRRRIATLVAFATLCLCVRTTQAEVGIGESGPFSVDTRYGFSGTPGDSSLFTVDTRYTGSAGDAASANFTVDTRTATIGNALVTGLVNVTSGGNGGGATITVLQNSVVRAQIVADASGRYALPLLAPGVYEIRATKGGYDSHIKRGVVIQPNSSLALDFWLSLSAPPPITQPVVRQAPPRLLGPPTSEQLKVWDGSRFVAGGRLTLDKPTVVMTHGWLAEPNNWAADMAGRMSNALAAIGREANLAAWDWQGAARSLLVLAYSRTPEEGEALGRALSQALPGNTKPIHFIGHSLGSLVNAQAANFLHQKVAAAFPSSRTHVTVLG